MLIFNLKKEWFEKIKSGEKTHEYRVFSLYWAKRINNAFRDNNFSFGMECKFLLGYPNGNDNNRILRAKINRIMLLADGRNTDLQTNKPVYDIEFELIKENKHEKN